MKKRKPVHNPPFDKAVAPRAELAAPETLLRDSHKRPSPPTAEGYKEDDEGRRRESQQASTDADTEAAIQRFLEEEL